MTIEFQEKFNHLPEALQREVMQFIDFLLDKAKQETAAKKKSGGKGAPNITFSWAGGLNDLKKDFTSVGLQHKINEYR
jgi:uncharacterized protein DUF2281